MTNISTEEATKVPVGRPTAYEPGFAHQVYKLCLLGATDKEIGDFFGVCEATVNNWKHAHPEFLESIRIGKEICDHEVAAKLYDRAIGASWIEETAFKVKRVEYENGKKVLEHEEIVTVPLQRAAPPDTPAIQFWLKNRRSGQWKDKFETDNKHQHGGLNININLGEEAND